jgi:hypothetical protein
MRCNVHNMIMDGLGWKTADWPIVAPHLRIFDTLSG